MDLGDILDEVVPSERTVQVCLRGDLAAQIDELEAELRRAINQRSDDDSLAGDGTAARMREIAEQIRQLEGKAEASMATFRFRSIGSQAWRKLLGQHPPSDEERKAGNDHAVDGFRPAAIKASLVDPTGTDEQIDQLLDRLSSSQFDLLWGTCFAANRGDGEAPKSKAASVVLRATGLKSEQQSSSASPEASS